MFKKAAYVYRQESFLKYMSMIVKNETAYARRLLICSLIEVVRSITERWFDKRRELAVSRDHMITERAYKKLSKQAEKGYHFVSRQTIVYIYKVEDSERSSVVDLQHHTCDCEEFQLDQMPCSHATTAIWSVGQNIYDYVEYYYKHVNMCLTYHECVYSVSNHDEWIIPFQQVSFTILPLIAAPQPG
ncbi:hypothetical protein C2S52_022013 [Perilla frutescens var. hirtella]|nr:hypothetical protein C2S52_022013 [Perilla frutescens var. hirtella]